MTDILTEECGFAQALQTLASNLRNRFGALKDLVGTEMSGLDDDNPAVGALKDAVRAQTTLTYVSAVHIEMIAKHAVDVFVAAQNLHRETAAAEPNLPARTEAMLVRMSAQISDIVSLLCSEIMLRENYVFADAVTRSLIDKRPDYTDALSTYSEAALKDSAALVALYCKGLHRVPQLALQLTNRMGDQTGFDVTPWRTQLEKFTAAGVSAASAAPGASPAAPSRMAPNAPPAHQPMVLFAQSPQDSDDENGIQ